LACPADTFPEPIAPAGLLDSAKEIDGVAAITRTPEIATDISVLVDFIVLLPYSMNRNTAAQCLPESVTFSLSTFLRTKIKVAIDPFYRQWFITIAAIVFT
jgi:hypothetical protein